LRLLVDTRTALWFLGGSKRLSETARSLLEDHTIERWVSAAAVWEVSIKRSTGKLKAPADFHERMREQGVRGLPVTDEHAAAVGELPMHHRDPFDRLIVAQAIAEGMAILSVDEILRAYDVPILW
jgi:PIN domain nuclease of toxin-antitoxin system